MTNNKLKRLAFCLMFAAGNSAVASDFLDESISANQQASYITQPVDFDSPLCCLPPWAHRSGISGEFLALRARDAEITYAIPVNGAVPEGRLGVLDGEYDPGFRLGLTKALDHCSSIHFSYSGFFSSSSDALTANAPLSLTKQLVHPNAINAAANVPNAFGNYDIDFHLADLEYRFVVLSNACTAANFSIGGRFGYLDQDLDVTYAGAGLTELVSSDITFRGGGLRLGADIEHHGRRGLFAYGKTAASFLAGEVEANYLHSSDVDPVVVASQWEAGRLMTILDLEVGVGWQHCSGCRVSLGYVYSAWLDTVKTDEWIGAVRDNAANYQDLGDGLSFDGFVARLEYRY